MDQERLLHDPVEVAVKSDGDWDVIMEKVPEMDSATIKQVFARAGRKWTKRDLDQQKAWMKREERKQAQKEPSAVINRPGRWKVDGGRVYLAAAKVKSGLTRADLEGIQKDLNL